MFQENPRTINELKHKLDELFESNNKEYTKISHYYDGKFHKDVKLYDRTRFEHYQIEKFKKSYYGDDYEIEIFAMDKPTKDG